MSLSERLQPVVTNQSKILFSSATGQDSISFSNTVVTPVLSPMLSLTKSTDKTSVSLGETLVYTLTALNGGNVPALVTAVDPLPQGVSFIANSVIRDGVPLPGIVPGSGIPLGSIAPGGRVTVAFQAIVVSLPQALELRNQALGQYTFRTPEGRLVHGELTSNEAVVSLLSYQLYTRLHASTSTTFIGDAVTYTLLLRNEGSLAMGGVTAVIPVPEGAEFIPGSVIARGIYSPGASPQGGIRLGTLGAGSSAEITFRVRVAAEPPGSLLTTAAQIVYEVCNATQFTESNSVQVRVIVPGVTVSLKVNYPAAAPGETLRYEFTVWNSGNQAVEAVLLGAVPAGTLFVWDSVRVNGAQLKGIRPAEGIPLGTLRPAVATSIVLEAVIPESADVRQLPAVQNQGSVQYTFSLPDGRSVQEADLSNPVTTLLFSPIIDIRMTGEPPIIEPGSIAIFNIYVHNSGNYPAHVNVARIVPVGSMIDPDRVTVSAVTVPEAASRGTVPLGTVAPEQSVHLQYHVRINPDFLGTSLQGSSTAIYTFEIDGRRFSGETLSNTYKLIIEEISE
ncbi:DUF11 domain-containing protein [Paenibacillus tengchongensis]|uniref:DUF11 domain-containing protein n=1 Tax=Paenibacillus tengchongensis TaxID=2608684 RepID=UPI00124CD360|nr:DUF11 domain-containing protein [Paenibacillus tengchongensis]